MPVLADIATPSLATRHSLSEDIGNFSLLGAITVAAILIHGYHPYIVDASIYVAGIKKRLDPLLYATDSAFVASHAKYSAFSLVMARLQMATHIPLDWLLLIAYAALLFVLLMLCYQLGKRIFHSAAAGWGATLLMAACLPVPVAATALLLIDPYLTARSFSSTLSLLAVLACVQQRWALAAGLCVVTTLAHPQMGVYLIAFALIYVLVAHRQWRWIAISCGAAFAACGMVYVATAHTPVTVSYREAILSRDFYFPTVWHWYEIVGLIAPLVLMGWTARHTGLDTAGGRLGLTCTIVGAASCVCCFCFVHPDGPYLLARLQLLRSYHTIYAVGTVMLGGAIAKQAAAAHRRLPWAGGLVLIAAGMFLLQRHIFSRLPDVEIPGTTVRNGWEEGFLWIRQNTPETALFAMDPRLRDFNDEGAPGFRALAERSLLTDVKDEGVASLLPPLAPEWAANRDKQILLESHSDRERIEQLSGSGVSWILLSRRATTELPCPYRNPVMQVCRLVQAHD